MVLETSESAVTLQKLTLKVLESCDVQQYSNNRKSLKVFEFLSFATLFVALHLRSVSAYPIKKLFRFLKMFDKLNMLNALHCMSLYVSF